MSRYFEPLQDIISPYAKSKLNKDFEYLFEGRQKIDQLNNRAESILTEAQQTNNMNKDVEAQVNKFISEFENEGTTNLEVVQARGGHTALNERLDENEHGIENNEKENFMTKVRNKTIQSAAVFIDDDGRREVLTKLKPIFEEEGVPLTLAIISGSVGKPDFINKTELLEFQEKGWEIASHTVKHPNLQSIGNTQKRNELLDSKKQLEQMGFDVNNIVYPFGADDLVTRNAAREAGYKGGTKTTKGINTIPVSRYSLNRVALGAYYATGENTLEYYKSQVDEALEKDGLVIFMTHAWTETHDTEQNGFVRDVIQYCKNLGMPIMTLNDAIKQFENIVDSGDVNKYTRVSTDGTFTSTNVPSLLSSEVVDFNKPANEYELNKITTQQVKADTANDFPNKEVGTLTTSVIGAYDWAYQLYNPVFSNTVYKRVWRNSGWTDFQKITANELNFVDALNGISATHQMSDLPENKITYATNNIAGGTNYPNNNAGMLTAFNFRDNGWAHEFFKEYNNNKIHIRGTKANGDFLEWDELTVKGKSVSQEISIGNISPNWSKDVVTTYKVDRIYDFPLVSTNIQLPIGVTFNAYINTGSHIVLRISNATNEKVILGSKYFRLSAIKG